MPPWLSVHLCHCLLLMIMALFFILFAEGANWTANQLVNAQKFTSDQVVGFISFLSSWLPIFFVFAPIYALLGWIPLNRRSKSTFQILRQNRFALAVLAIMRRHETTRPLPYLKAHKQRWVLLLLKGIFIPIAIGSSIGALKTWGSVSETFGVWNALLERITWRELGEIMARGGQMMPWHQLIHYPVTYGILLLDGIMASLGYLSENKSIGGRIRAVDTKPSSWAACLPCYPPMLMVTVLFLAQSRTEHDLLFSTGSPAILASQLLGLGFFVLYGWGVWSMKGRYSNLTYRSVVTTGPFKFIRHPLYTFKILGWFFEWLPLLGSMHNALALTGFAVIYGLRVHTEERFLGSFSDYTAYIKQVKWRCIPGLW